MWLIIGMILGALILGLVLWLRSKNMSMKWYEWLIGIIGVALLLFTIQNFVGSYAEFESTAGNVYLLLLGLPALILLGATWRLVIRHKKTA